MLDMVLPLVDTVNVDIHWRGPQVATLHDPTNTQFLAHCRRLKAERFHRLPAVKLGCRVIVTQNQHDGPGRLSAANGSSGVVVCLHTRSPTPGCDAITAIACSSTERPERSRSPAT